MPKSLLVSWVPPPIGPPTSGKLEIPRETLFLSASRRYKYCLVKKIKQKIQILLRGETRAKQTKGRSVAGETTRVRGRGGWWTGSKLAVHLLCFFDRSGIRGS
jgi:hypothetical protein